MNGLRFEDKHRSLFLKYNLFFVVVLSFFLSVFLVYVINLSITLSIAYIFILPISLLVLFRPSYGSLIFIFLILILEEFPGGLGGDSVQRSIRMPFYSTSIIIPGVYSTDILLFGLITIFLMHYLIRPEQYKVKIDGVCLALFLMMACVVLSVTISFLSSDPFSEGIIRLTSGTAYKISEKGAQLVVFFHIKIYMYLMFSYILGLLFITTNKKIEDILKVALIAAIIFIFIGVIRVAVAPGIVKSMIPVFYHSPTSWFFGIFIFFTVLAWAYDININVRKSTLIIISAILMIFVLISFRRTMWGAILISACTMLFFIPREKYYKVFFIILSLLALLGMFLFLTPVGSTLVSAVSSRLDQTTVAETSTLYRLALFVYFFSENVFEIPFFGYGVTPLWNKMVSLGYFRINLENIHSLYFWVLLRTGFFGFFIFIISSVYIAAQMIRYAINTTNQNYKVITVSIFLAFLMLSFSGIFNPVYGEARYMILMGLMLAMFSRMRQIEYMGRKNNNASDT